MAIQCERCGTSNHVVYDIRPRSLNVEMSGRKVMLAQFTLCRECNEYGCLIEPISRIAAFLNPAYQIITNIVGDRYYIEETATGEYVKNEIGRVWETDSLEVAQDKLAELDGMKIVR